MPETTTTSESESPYCHSCGATVDPAANFCPQCGVTVSHPSRAAFCPGCGEAFDSDDEFCSQCGHPRSDSSGETDQSGSAHSQKTHEEFRQRVRNHVKAGWELDADYGDRVTLVDRNIGSLLLHALLLLTTYGVGNILYGWYHYMMCAETRYLSVDNQWPSDSSETDSSEDRELVVDSGFSKAFSYLIGSSLLFTGLFLSVLALSAGSLLGGVTALWLILGGIVFFPPAKRRLRNRHRLTKFGRLKTVDQRIIDPYEECEESCVVCGDDITGGLHRRRRDETVVAGIPVVPHEINHNYYCVDCARAEVGISESSTANGETERLSTAEMAEMAGETS